MKVLITGASGFIGRNLLLSLPKDWQVVAIYHRDATFPDFLHQHFLKQVTPLKLNLLDKNALEQIDNTLHNYDACIYLAANGDPAYSQDHPLEDLSANTVALLNTVSTWKFGHFIYFSSGAVYDGLTGPVNPDSAVNPLLPYAISKWAAERYVFSAKKRAAIKRATIVRFFGAYGPYEAERKIYGRLVKQFAFARDPKFTIRGDGKNLIDAMYVDDTIKAILLLLNNAVEDEIIDLYSGAPFTLTELVCSAANAFDLVAKIDFVDQVPEYIRFYSTDKTMDVKYGFKPSLNLAEGMQQFYVWIKAQREQGQCLTEKAC